MGKRSLGETLCAEHNPAALFQAWAFRLHQIHSQHSSSLDSHGHAVMTANPSDGDVTPKLTPCLSATGILNSPVTHDSLASSQRKKIKTEAGQSPHTSATPKGLSSCVRSDGGSSWHTATSNASEIPPALGSGSVPIAASKTSCYNLTARFDAHYNPPILTASTTGSFALPKSPMINATSSRQPAIASARSVNCSSVTDTGPVLNTPAVPNQEIARDDATGTHDTCPDPDDHVTGVCPRGLDLFLDGGRSLTVPAVWSDIACGAPNLKPMDAVQRLCDMFLHRCPTDAERCALSSMQCLQVGDSIATCATAKLVFMGVTHGTSRTKASLQGGFG